jgi:hypothetical protein
MFFQRSPVSGTKQSLGRQNAGCRASGNSFGADKFRDGLAIVHRSLPLHDSATSAVFAGHSLFANGRAVTGLLRLTPDPAFRHRCRRHTVTKSSCFSAKYRQNKCVQFERS